MTTLFIDKESYEALQHFGEKHKDDGTFFERPCAKEFRVILDGMNGMSMYMTSRHYGWHFRMLNSKKEQLLKGKIVPSATPELRDFDIIFKINEEYATEPEKLGYLIQLHSTALMHGEAFLRKGENEPRFAEELKDLNNKNVVFRERNGKIYAVPVGMHVSPDGVFSVSGHLRHYKDGKVIWIDPYFKGLSEND